jgi:regulator of sigma E protease
MSTVVVVLLIGLLILIHEAGHYLGALWMGIPVRRFAIGFGPKLASFTRGETEFALCAIPLGGYVLPAIEHEDDWFNVPVGKRLVFLFGGPLANILFAVPLFAVLNSIADSPTLFNVLVAPWLQTAAFALTIAMAIPMLFSDPSQLSGVVGIVSQGKEMVGVSVAQALTFAIAISINLAVFNLLPIPILDGGKILLAILEKFRPALARRAYVPLMIGGLLMILLLFIYATALDIGRLFA